MRRFLTAPLGVAVALGLMPTAAFGLPEDAAPESDVAAGSFSAPSVAAQARYNYPVSDADELSANALSVEEPLPSAFDLRGGGNVTSVKFQNPWGSCWTFATMASLESNVLKQGASTQSGQIDYSERQLAWFGRTAVGAETDPLQAGEGSFAECTAGSSWTPTQLAFNGGGDFGTATALLSSWFGAADEVDIPYTDMDGNWSASDTSGDWSLAESDRTLSSVHLKESNSLPSPATFTDVLNPSTSTYKYDPQATEAIKKALLSDGAVTLGYHADQSRPNQETKHSKYFNYAEWSQYVNEFVTQDDPATEEDDRTTANHAVTIVGWDDSFSKNNFTTQPPEDGAWIIKNSWSEKWGLQGYFYLSYYDMSLAMPTSFKADVRKEDGSFSYDVNYQYDYLGSASVAKVEPGKFGNAVAANVFVAKGNEVLKAVSATTANPNSEVRIDVYLLDDDAQSPTDGVRAASKTETVAYGGYHTIGLDNSIPLDAGQRFSVVESICGYQGSYLPLEVAAYDENDPDEAAGGFVKNQKAVANKGESYYSTDGGATWDDVVNLKPSDVQQRISSSIFGGYAEVRSVGNAMIKAFTVDGDDAPDPAQAARFDPREQGLSTPVRNQGSLDLCGPFATMASLETSLLFGASTASELANTGLSPFQAVYFTTIGNEEREAAGMNQFMPDNPYGGGTGPYRLAASLAAGKGAAVLRAGVTDGPYNPLDESLRFASDVRLTGTANLGNGADACWEAPGGQDVGAAVKRIVSEEGPVVAEFYSGQGFNNFDYSYSSYYVAPGITGAAADHYIAIVGWDDNFSRHKFNQEMQPASDGAWLAKNSWGTEHGEGGYYWISYEDASLMFQSALFGEAKRAGESIYQYDEMGWLDSMSLGGTTGWAANVFTSVRNERLDRVQFCTTGRNTAYTVGVYRLAADAVDPRAGTLVSTCAGVREDPGYVTVTLDTAVDLATGDSFSVVVKLQNATYAYPIAVEAYTPDPELRGSEPQYMGKDAQGLPETSWVSLDGASWTNPAGYGAYLARDSSGGGGVGSTPGAAQASDRADEGAGSTKSYVTNVCVKALTMPRDAGDAGGSDGSATDDAAVPSVLVATGDATGALPAVLVSLAACAATALLAFGGQRRAAKGRE